MIQREMTSELLTLINEYPVVTILGPRQAGKTTLAKSALSGRFQYCNLELPNVRELAEYDPKTFLNQFHGPVVLDEIQRVPKLLSYIQAKVDDSNLNGQYVLTGSYQAPLREAVSQSLAGRTAILQLLPLSITELSRAGYAFDNFAEYVLRGFLPRIYSQNQRPHQAYANYYQTYVERDVRQLINLKDVVLFEKFLKLVAGRAGQLIDYTSLGNDTGVDAKTVKNWLSILEASFVLFKLPPFFDNFGKRAMKSPKYYFLDVGLLGYLLGLESQKQVERDPLVGNIFENLIIVELLKNRLNAGRVLPFYFYRDSRNCEIDLMFNWQGQTVAMEIKSSATFSKSLIANLNKLKTTINFTKGYLIYNGDTSQIDQDTKALNFRDSHHVFDP